MRQKTDTKEKRDMENDNDSIVLRRATSPGMDRQVLKLICLTHILHRDQRSTAIFSRPRLVQSMMFSQPCGGQGRNRGFYHEDRLGSGTDVRC